MPPSESPQPFDQSTYQVRFEWGAEGLRRLAPVDVVVVVDVLSFSTDVIAAVESGATVALDADARAASPHGASVAEAAAESGAVVILGALRNAAAVAAAVLAEQERRGVRTSVAVIAAGEPSPEVEASVRFAVEDLLGAGAVIAALADRGIDHSSPEAAAPGEAFRALRAATRHLLTASGSGRALADRREDVRAAAEVDTSSAVPVLREGVFAALDG